MQYIKQIKYSAFENVLFKFFFVFSLLFINSFSFPHHYIPDIGKYTHSFFEILVTWSAKNIFNIRHTYTSKLISDSTGFYINAANIIFISMIICAVWSIADRNRKTYHVLKYWFIVLISYYLALQLFTYGFSKIFKWQFYLPEPNTLFTTVGNTPSDLLYWSTMGSSRMYTIFSGLTEVLPALLLLFKRTRAIGAFIATAVMANVVMINFSFDISVKLYSCFLLLLSIIIASPALIIIWRIIVHGNPVIIKQWIPAYKSKISYWVYFIIKFLVIAVILADVLSPYFKEKNFNDDTTERPILHGAYEVSSFIKNNDTLAPLLTNAFYWKKIFIHRRGYFITQTMDDEMQSYDLEYDTDHHDLIIKKYEDTAASVLHYQHITDSTLLLSGSIKEDSIKIYLKKIDLTKLPLLQKEFHWTIDY